MNLSQHIKDFRQRDGLSQENLAERIFVTRQTISNWETGRSYPDVQSLLMLSVLFDVSLDELVKGDVEMMKNEIDVYRMNVWSWVMLICCVVGLVALLPMHGLFGWAGLILPVVLLVVGFSASIVLERIKKKHSIQTYSEILSFMEGTALNEERVAREKKHAKLTIAAKLMGGALVGFALVLISGLLYNLLSG